MKKSLLIGLVSCSCITLPAQMVMNPGDTYVYHFDSLQYINTDSTFTEEGGQLRIFPAGPAPGAMFRMELFEGLAEGTAATENTYIFGTPIPPRVFAPGLWADREGSIRITALSGQPFTINQIEFTRHEPVQSGPGFDHYGLSIVPVPEPSAFALGILGAITLYFKSHKRSRRIALTK